MSDTQDLRVEPTPVVGGSAAVQPVRAEAQPAARGEARPDASRASAAASTGGNLRAAYAQFVVDPDTHDVVVRIRDSSTNEVLSELPSREVQEMQKYLQTYAETLARHRAALQRSTAS